MQLNQFFQTVFCITLEVAKDNPEHPERLLAAIREFQKHGISVEFVDGVDGRLLDIAEPMSSDGDSVVRKADMGCTLSHLKVAQMAKDRNLKNYCVFEDDVVLKKDFQRWFSKFITQLDFWSPWKMLYLGGDNQGALEAIGPNIIGTSRTLTTHAYGVNNCAYDLIIQALSRHEKVDLNMVEVHKTGWCYIMHPVLAGQRAGWSYILNKQVQNEHKFFEV